MKKLLSHFPLALLLTWASNHCFSQYVVNGSARPVSCNCYTLTTEAKYDSGSVWNANKIDLTRSFDFHFNVFLGCSDMLGADGIAFVLQPASTALGNVGEGLGFEGISPSVGISLDTYQNTNRHDPPYDHIGIQLNGIITHDHDLAGPVQASATSDNIEDCQWHGLRVTWDASAKTLAVYFDGEFRVQATYDLVGNVFHNDPMVYWGFSGATGGGYNLQQFCTSLNPVFKTNLADTFTCIGHPLIFTDQSESFAAIKDFYWDFGDGFTTTLQNPPPHNYSLPGSYIISHVITGIDGCISDTMKKTINIGAKPVADFSLSDTCTHKTLGIADRSRSDFGRVSQWTWWLDGMPVSTDSIPAIHDLPEGPHELRLAESTVYGCNSDTVTKSFSIHPTPVVDIVANKGCWKQAISISGRQLDYSTTITEWNWQFGDGELSHGQHVLHTYQQGGGKTIHLMATADDGCGSNDTTKEIYIESVYADAGQDTSVQANIPFQLTGTLGGNFTGVPLASWSPPAGLNGIFGLNPTAILQTDQVYHLRITTDAGCNATDSVRIRVFDFPGVLVPTAFTPNHDGLNDLLRPRYNGIRHLDYFSVYDRWGRVVFKTADMGTGWDGNVNGQPQPTQVFVWIVSAEDFKGKKYQLRGTTTLIR